MYVFLTEYYKIFLNKHNELITSFINILVVTYRSPPTNTKTTANKEKIQMTPLRSL